MPVSKTLQQIVMQKKLVAVAVVSALGAPDVALAQSSTVQVFGTVYVEWAQISRGTSAAAGNPGLPSVDMLQTPGSEIGFKGEEKLGGGLSAWFQCASTADPRGQSQNGWCSRNSGLGLKGEFGNVWVGNWRTPLSRVTFPTAVGSNENGIWGSSYLLTAGSSTSGLPPTGATPARATFKRRQNNTLFYDTPTWGPFLFMAAISSTQSAIGATTAATNNKARVWGIAARYRAGPLYVGVGYEKHNEFNSLTGGRDGDDTGWGAGAVYTWGPVRFGVQYQHAKWETGTTAAPTNSKVGAWEAGIDWNIAGPHGLRAAYIKAEKMKGTPGAVAIAGSGATRPAVPTLAAAAAFGDNTGANLWLIRYIYTMSKRTEFNLGYAKLDNKGNTTVGGDYVIGGLASPGMHALGNDQHAWGSSLRHTF
jgi:predicted porin